MGQVRQVQKWLAQKKKSADFKSSDLGSSAYTLINYPQNLTEIIFYIFFLQPRLIFIGIKVMRPSRKEISSMLFIFTPKELKWTVMRKNWRPNCTTTGLLHILNLVRWWELSYPFFFLFWSYWTVGGNFLKKVIILNVCPKRNSPEKYICLILASQKCIEVTYLLPQISMSITSFS